MIKIAPHEMEELRPRISVIGVGGAGGNAVANMIASEVKGVKFAVANTDAQALNGSQPDQRIQLGRLTTEGLGAGSIAAVGKAAAEESIEDIGAALEGAHMCFIAAGMGGGTGSGAAAVIARVAREKGILTVGVVTTPFVFEGARRARVAAAGIEELRKHVDTLIVIPNQNLFRIANRETTFKEAFQMANEVLQQGVRGITDLMVMPGLINLDFADIRSVMGGMGKAMMGTGEASGPNRAVEAAEMAVSNPLLDGAITGARGIIISITGGEDMRLMEIDEAANCIKDLIDPEADIIWGSAINPQFDGRMRVSIVATGLDGAAGAPHAAAPNAAIAPFKPMPLPLAVSPVAKVEPAKPVAPVCADLFEEPSTAALEPELLLHPDEMISASVPHRRPNITRGAMSRADVLPDRGASLFERMAGLVRAAATAETRHIRAPVMAGHEATGVYNRRSLRLPREALTSHRTVASRQSPRLG